MSLTLCPAALAVAPAPCGGFVQLAPGGDWRLRVIERVSEFDQYDATLTVPVG